MLSPRARASAALRPAPVLAERTIDARAHWRRISSPHPPARGKPISSTESIWSTRPLARGLQSEGHRALVLGITPSSARSRGPTRPARPTSMLRTKSRDPDVDHSAVPIALEHTSRRPRSIVIPRRFSWDPVGVYSGQRLHARSCVGLWAVSPDDTRAQRSAPIRERAERTTVGQVAPKLPAAAELSCLRIVRSSDHRSRSPTDIVLAAPCIFRPPGVACCGDAYHSPADAESPSWPSGRGGTERS